MATQAGMGDSGFLRLTLGLSTGLAGAAGVWLGGLLADRFGRSDVRAYVTIPAFASLAALPGYAVIFSIVSGAQALEGFPLPHMLGVMWMSPGPRTQHNVTPPE